MSLQNISATSISDFVIVGFDSLQRPLTVGVVVLLIYILIMLANIANIFFIVMDKRLHQPMYLFICNLAFVDILNCTSACPTMISNLVIGCKTISFISCIVQMYVFHLCGIMEKFAVTVMAFDRFIAIGSPLRYHSILTNARSLLIIIVLWMVAFALLAILPATVIPLPFCQATLKYIFCDYAAVIRATCVDPNSFLNIASSISFIIIFGTFSFICLSYLKIIIVIVNMSSKNDKMKAFNTCLSHLIIIVCYYAPLFTLIVLTRVGVVLTLEERHGLLIGAILGPSLVNPFIYCLRTKEIRNKVLRILSKVEPAAK